MSLCWAKLVGFDLLGFIVDRSIVCYISRVVGNYCNILRIIDRGLGIEK